MTEIDWTYDESRRLFHIHYHGLVGLDVFERVREIRASIGVELGGLRLLIDARDADLSELTAEDFKALEQTRSENMGMMADRAAGLLGREIDLGIAQLWALYRNQSVPRSTAVFLSEREAVKWLLSDDPDRDRGDG